jgi:hypothetical protein
MDIAKYVSKQKAFSTEERSELFNLMKAYEGLFDGTLVKWTGYTDHKNLTYKVFNTQRVMRWRLLIEEYGPTLQYVKGVNNVVADALSRLELDLSLATESRHRATPQF